MIPGLAPQAIDEFIGFSVEHVSTDPRTVEIPRGAKSVTIEVISGGSTGSYLSGPNVNYGGDGGGYAKTIEYPVAGLAALYLTIPARSGNGKNIAGGECNVRANDAAGTILCQARGGSPSTGPGIGLIGDILYRGGSGVSISGTGGAGGGGAAGPLGNGGNGSGATPGAPGGSPAGAGDGSDYGGGGLGATGSGGAGWVRLTWA